MKKGIFISLTGLVVLAILFLGLSTFAQQSGGISIPNPLSCPDVGCVLKRIAGFLFAIATPILAIMVIWAGFLFLTSGGNPEKVATAKKALIWAVIGFAIVLINWGFADIIAEILGGSERTNNGESRPIPPPGGRPVPF